MTNFTTRMMIAAATVVVAAGVASAQTMKAEIPFTFRAGDKVMAAGSYRISNLSHNSGVPTFQMVDAARHSAVIVTPYTSTVPKEAWAKAGTPVLSFDCAGASCALAGVWAGSGMPAYTIHHRKLEGDAPVRVALIAIRPDRGE